MEEVGGRRGVDDTSFVVWGGLGRFDHEGEEQLREVEVPKDVCAELEVVTICGEQVDGWNHDSPRGKYERRGDVRKSNARTHY